jgi:hypothetical protein
LRGARKWARFAALAAACTALWGASGCSKKPDVVVATADRVFITDAEIDQDPVALLPGGAIGIIRADAPAFYASAFGQRIKRVADSRLPLPPSAGFDPQRDLTTLWIGLYSMAGADFATVCQGTFNAANIERAADGVTLTPLGAPLVKTTYAKRTLFVSKNIGFTILTARTAIFGNETGIRRALDRLSEGRARHELSPEVDQALQTPNAPLASAWDFSTEPPAEALVKNLPFLAGVKKARIIGNFQPPGVNLAGTLSYPDDAAAQAGTQQILNTNQTIQRYSFLMQLVGIGNPLQGLQAQAVGPDAQFAVGVDQKAIEWILNQVADRAGVQPSTGIR